MARQLSVVFPTTRSCNLAEIKSLLVARLSRGTGSPHSEQSSHAFRHELTQASEPLPEGELPPVDFHEHRTRHFLSGRGPGGIVSSLAGHPRVSSCSCFSAVAERSSGHLGAPDQARLLHMLQQPPDLLRLEDIPQDLGGFFRCLFRGRIL